LRRGRRGKGNIRKRCPRKKKNVFRTSPKDLAEGPGKEKKDDSLGKCGELGGKEKELRNEEEASLSGENDRQDSLE